MFYIDKISNKDLCIVAEEENFLDRASLLYDEISIDGKDGSEYVQKKYLNVVGSLNIKVLNPNKIDDIIPFFTGNHTLIYNDRETKISFFDTIPIIRFGSIKAFTVSFIRSPFWYSNTNTKEKASSVVYNNGNVYSRPLIELRGTGVVNIKINNIEFEYTFDNDNVVYIDCEEKSEYFNDKNKSKNIKIGFDYPILNVGKNEVSIDGSCELYFFRKDRWL